MRVADRQHDLNRGLRRVQPSEHFGKCRKAFEINGLRRFCGDILASKFTRKVDWHGVCFTPKHEPSITVKPVTK